jgi:ABC-2 type transport system ATP-binding protein
MIESGRMVFKDSMESFNNYIEPDSLITTMENPPPEAELRAIKGIREVQFLTEKTIRMRFEPAAEIAENIVEISVRRGWRLKEITLEKSSLDAIFAQLSNKKTKPALQ